MEPTYKLIVHKPGKVVKLGGRFETVGAGALTVGTGKRLAEACAWARRSPRFRMIEPEA